MLFLVIIIINCLEQTENTDRKHIFHQYLYLIYSGAFKLKTNIRKIPIVIADFFLSTI